MELLEIGGGEALGCLNGSQTGAFRSAEHYTVGVDGLDGVCQRQCRHHCGAAVLQGLNHSGDQRRRCQRTRSVVYQDEIGVARGIECCTDRLGTVGSARDHGDLEIRSTEDQRALIGPARRNRHHNSVYDA